MQLYSVEQQRSQALEAHAAAFTTLRLPGKTKPSPVISFAQKNFVGGQINSKLHVIELGAPGATRGSTVVAVAVGSFCLADQPIRTWSRLGRRGAACLLGCSRLGEQHVGRCRCG